MTRVPRRAAITRNRQPAQRPRAALAGCLGTLTLATVAVAMAAGGGLDLDLSPPTHFSVFLVNEVSRRAETLDLAIMQWSSDADGRQLGDSFDADGLPGMARLLGKMPRRGFLAVAGNIGVPLQFAEEVSVEGGASIVAFGFSQVGRRVLAPIVAATATADQAGGADVPGPLEQPTGPDDAAMTEAYPFTVVQVNLNANGTGTGTLYPVARMTSWDLGTGLMFFENGVTKPLPLTQVVLQTRHR